MNLIWNKICQFCGNRFVAKKTTTKCCSDDCAKKFYKKRKRDEKIHINGQLTISENIADLGGLTLAYHALEKSYDKKSSLHLLTVSPGSSVSF